MVEQKFGLKKGYLKDILKKYSNLKSRLVELGITKGRQLEASIYYYNINLLQCVIGQNPKEN